MNFNFCPRGFNSTVSQLNHSDLQKQPVNRAITSTMLARSPIVSSNYKTSAKRKRNVWSNEEDSVLFDAVKKEDGSKINWIAVAKRVKKASGDSPRTGKQCRERWQNHLRPNIKKGDWSTEEEDMIQILHQTFGARWSDMSKLMKNRTDNDIKNKWNSMQRSRVLKKAKRGWTTPDVVPQIPQSESKELENNIDPDTLEGLIVHSLRNDENPTDMNGSNVGEGALAIREQASSDDHWELGLNTSFV